MTTMVESTREPRITSSVRYFYAKSDQLDISILLRGRKKLTLIHGLKEIYDFKKILKYWRKVRV